MKFVNTQLPVDPYIFINSTNGSIILDDKNRLETTSLLT